MDDLGLLLGCRVITRIINNNTNYLTTPAEPIKVCVPEPLQVTGTPPELNPGGGGVKVTVSAATSASATGIVPLITPRSWVSTSPVVSLIPPAKPSSERIAVAVPTVGVVSYR